jgi:Flp pilus assembly protein TadG
MIQSPNTLRLIPNRKGATALEFALIAPVMFMALMAIFDLGHGFYLRSVLYGAMQKAARDNTLETGSAQMAAIDNRVRNAVMPILTGGTLIVSRTATKSFTAAGGAEPFTDANANATRDAGECFDDENGNGSWDATAGSAGLGGTDSVVTYTATVAFNHLFPTPSLLGWAPVQTIKTVTVLRNQPYGDASPPTSICT